MGKKLSLALLRKTLRGYRRLNKLTAEEERAWAARLTPKEAWATFDRLYEVWERMGKRSGGDWAAIENQRLDEKLTLRRTLDRAAGRR